MPRPERFTIKQIADELHHVLGAMTLAAENLGTTYNTIRRYVDKSTELQKLIAHYRERRVDKAELKLEEALGKSEPWAIALVLKTLGKNRGYVERQEQTGKDGAALVPKQREVIVLGQSPESDREGMQRVIADVERLQGQRNGHGSIHSG